MPHKKHQLNIHGSDIPTHKRINVHTFTQHNFHTPAITVSSTDITNDCAQPASSLRYDATHRRMLFFVFFTRSFFLTRPAATQLVGSVLYWVTPMWKAVQYNFTALGGRHCNTHLSKHAHLSKGSQNNIKFCVVSNAVINLHVTVQCITYTRTCIKDVLNCRHTEKDEALTRAPKVCIWCG